jgi:hypothetical protein
MALTSTEVHLVRRPNGLPVTDACLSQAILAKTENPAPAAAR